MTCTRRLALAAIVGLTAGLFSFAIGHRTTASPEAPSAAAAFRPDPVLVDAARVFISLAVKYKDAVGSYPTDEQLRAGRLLSDRVAGADLPADAHPAWHQLKRTAALLKSTGSPYTFTYTAAGGDAVFVGQGPSGDVVYVKASEGVIYNGAPPSRPGVRVAFAGGQDYGTCGQNGYGWCQGWPNSACWMNGVPGCEWCCSVNCSSCCEKAVENGTICYQCPPCWIT